MFLGIAGRIGSGKTTFARGAAARLGFRRIGFGDHIRAIAQSRGLNSSDRAVLQELGQTLVSADPHAFLASLLSRADYRPAENVVLDGIRHVEIWREVAALAGREGSRALLVLLTLPDGDRRPRVASRGMDWETAVASDKHASEADLEHRIGPMADLILDGRLSEKRLIDSVVELMEVT